MDDPDLPKIDSMMAAEARRQEALKARPRRARYDVARSELDHKWRRRELKADRMMGEVLDVLWDHFADSPYVWCAFYILSPESVLIRESFRGREPAARQSLDGFYGNVLRGAGPFISGKAEGAVIALPVSDEKGKVWAVFAAEASPGGSFDSMDERWLEIILKSFGHTAAP